MDKPVLNLLENNINISLENKCFCIEAETERLFIKDYRDSDFKILFLCIAILNLPNFSTMESPEPLMK